MRKFWRWVLSLFGKSKPTPLYMGVSVYTGWASPRPEYGWVPGVQCPSQWPWREMKKPDRTPAIGEYDERDRQVTDWRIEQMIRGKIDFCTYQHEWSPHLGTLTMNHCAENHPPDSAIEFAMSWWDSLTNSTDGEKYFAGEYWEPHTAAWTAERVAASLKAYSKAVLPITQKASYLKIDGRPVLFRGLAHSLRFYERWDISPKQALDLMASAFVERPYFVATATDQTVLPLLKGWGFDAFTEYTLYAESWVNVMQTYRDYWERGIEIAKETGIDFWVPVFAGFDTTAWLPADQAMSFEPPTPQHFTDHLIEAREFARKNYRETRGRLCCYAWSEYYEGGILEPMRPGMLHDGDELLLAHARAVA